MWAILTHPCFAIMLAIMHVSCSPRKGHGRRTASRMLRHGTHPHLSLGEPCCSAQSHICGRAELRQQLLHVHTLMHAVTSFAFAVGFCAAYVRSPAWYLRLCHPRCNADVVAVHHWVFCLATGLATHMMLHQPHVVCLSALSITPNAWQDELWIIPVKLYWLLCESDL